MLKRVILGLVFSALTATAQAAPKQTWSVWLAELKQDAVASGIQPAFFDEVFVGIRPNKRVLNFDRRQPEKRLTYYKYRNTRASSYRISLGRKKFRRYSDLLTQVGKEYKIDPCIIASLWGMESSYGHYMGKFSVIKSLATLAYDDRRAKFFRRELLLALHILAEGHITQNKFVGEWAGGTGQPQFLPSSWRQYSVDHNGDGRRDIWTTHADVFASIANYLIKNGWQSGQPWSARVNVPPGFDKNLVGYKVEKPLSEWLALGIEPKHRAALPSNDPMASLLQPYGGPSFLAFKNFRVILRYNRSTFYAGTIGYMANKICKRPFELSNR